MEVIDYINTYGEEWCIAAVVDGSIGYYTPLEAKRLIEEYKSGKRECYSERCIALYGGDMERMLLSDFQKFEFLHRHGETAPILRKIREWMEMEEGAEPVASMTMGLMYPTL